MLTEADKLRFYAAWAKDQGQHDLAIRLSESAVRVGRIERALDEIVADAMQDELIHDQAQLTLAVESGAARLAGRLM